MADKYSEVKYTLVAPYNKEITREKSVRKQGASKRKD